MLLQTMLLLYVLLCGVCVFGAPSCRWYRMSDEDTAESPLHFCDVYVNTVPNEQWSSMYVCNSTGNGIEYMTWTNNLECSGAPFIKEDVTQDIYEFDCSKPICSESNPTVSWKTITNCTMNVNTYYNVSAITNDCVVSGTHSGIIKCNDKPPTISFEIYYHNTKCNGIDTDTMILYDGCNYNNTQDEQFDTIFNCTVPVPITAFQQENQFHVLDYFRTYN
eukprot:457901_1